MKRLRWLITAPLALILILFAVNNRHIVEVSLWPLDFIVRWPLFVLVFIGVLAGFLAGAFIAWASTAQRHRRHRRQHSGAGVQSAPKRRKDSSDSSEGTGPTTPAVID